MSAGDRLREMLARAGYSFDSFARAVGFRGASSLQRYVSSDRDFIAFDKVERFAPHLIGRGQPPILREEVYALSGIAPNPSNPAAARDARAPRSALLGDIELAKDNADLGYAHRDLPLIGKAQPTGEGYTFGDGSEVLALTARPVELSNVRGAYAVYIHSDAMAPRFRPGEMLYVDPIRPATSGDDVVVRLSDGTGYVKQLVRRTPKAVICCQHNPLREIEYPADQVTAVHLIVAATRIRV